MTERMQYLWCERWPLIFWFALAMLFEVKSLVVWCLVFSFVILLTKLDKGTTYLVTFVVGFPIAMFLD